MPTCSYCGRDSEMKTPCRGCGAMAWLDAKAARPGIQTREAYFAYNGYVVWEILDPARQQYDWLFYRGAMLCGTVRFSRNAIREMGVREGDDVMPLVWETFCRMTGDVDHPLLEKIQDLSLQWRGPMVDAIYHIAQLVGWNTLAEYAARQAGEIESAEQIGKKVASGIVSGILDVPLYRKPGDWVSDDATQQVHHDGLTLINQSEER